jgi:hypothetical protein
MSSLAKLPTPPDATPPVAPTSSNELLKWQRKLLPLMTRFLIALAILFFVFSAFHLYQVSTFIETEHGNDIRAQIQAQIDKSGQAPSGEEVLQNSLLLLEADTLDKRYHQASALLLSRIWSRQLAFITGMVMAFLGSVFILGKLSEATSTITGEGSQWKVGISSASPGIILSFFGTILLVATLVVRTTLDLSDGPAYITALRRPASSGQPVTPPASGDDATKPLDLNELQHLGVNKDKPADKQK